MIILKQDKKGIVNFKNVTDIYVDKGEDEDKYFLFYIPVCSLEGLDILGIYETEERAKEVLQEIIEEYKSQQYIVFNAENGEYKQIENKRVYEMPKE